MVTIATFAKPAEATSNVRRASSGTETFITKSMALAHFYYLIHGIFDVRVNESSYHRKCSSRTRAEFSCGVDSPLIQPSCYGLRLYQLLFTSLLIWKLISISVVLLGRMQSMKLFTAPSIALRIFMSDVTRTPTLPWRRRYER